MKTPDINEIIKERLSSFLITNWIILPSEDLAEQIRLINKKESVIKITDANAILWFARGRHDSVFFLKDYSLSSKIPEVVNLPMEYMGALVVHKRERCILSACWSGQEFIMMNEIKTCFGPFPISKTEVKFCTQITESLSSF